MGNFPIYTSRMLQYLSPRAYAKLRQSALCVFVCAALAACGGGASLTAGGVGSGGSGLAEGSVTGFGSVIVDGVAYDDTYASVVQDNAQGSTDQARAKLGQRVRISQSQSGVADRIVVLPQLRGVAQTAPGSDGRFMLLGQRVRIISASDTLNTATVFDGLTSVSAGDALEVHGHWVSDASAGVPVLIASRIEKLTTSPDPVLISGVVRARNGNTITLDNAGGTMLEAASLPPGIAAQSLISAWVPAAATSGTTWPATRLVDASPRPDTNQSLVLGTQITAGDLLKGTVQVQGLTVKLPAGTVAAPPQTGTPVQLSITRDGDDWKAVSVTSRQTGDDLGGAVELKGTLLWPASATTLTLRDVSVTVPTGVLDSGCSGVKAGDAVYLRIKAQRTAPGQPLQATRVECSQQTPDDSVIELDGQLTRLLTDSTGTTGSLVVNTAQGTRTFQWTALTERPRDLAGLLNRDVEVEYQVIGGVNRLRRIKPD